jgi:predicted nucleic acid-binding protein
MTMVFADTFFYLALLNPGDSAHAKTVEFSRSFRARTLTTAWIITEVGDALAAPSQRPLFVRFLDNLRHNPSVEIIPPSDELFEEGIRLFSRRSDKSWSLTDCISFTAMTRFGLDKALTGDRHFEQAGFAALLLD